MHREKRTEASLRGGPEAVWDALFFWQGVASSVREELKQDLPAPRCYARGDRIYDSAHFDRALGVVLEGELAVYRLTDGHTRQQRLGVGHVFGAAALFGEEPYITEITAVKRSQVLFVSEERLSAWLARSPQIAQNYIRFLTERIRFLNAQLRGCTGDDTQTRLMRYLQEQADDNGRVTCSVPWSTLAEQLGMGRSSLYRARDRLMESGWLIRQGEQLSIHQEKGEWL